jgi:hypothetical protein
LGDLLGYFGGIPETLSLTGSSVPSLLGRMMLENCVGNGNERKFDSGLRGPKMTNPEGCEPIHLDQQLALDPHQTCTRCFQLIRLAAPRGPGLSSGLTDQSGKPIRSSGSYLAFYNLLFASTSSSL